MNIGFDASRAFNNNRTGTENYSYQILYHLLQLDHTNKYYIYGKPGFKGRPCQARPPLIRPIIIPFPRLWTQVGLAFQTFKDPLDILFVPAHTLPIIKKPGLKTVITIHDLGAEYLPGTHQLKQRLYLNFMTYHQLKSASHIIAVSEATKKDIVQKTGIPASKITVIYEGYNKNIFKPVNNIKLSRKLSTYNLQPTTYFLFVGTIQPRKNLERLIKAYAEFLKLGKGKKVSTSIPSLVLVGSRGWLSDEIYELPKKLGIEKNVKFLGYVPDEDLPALYSGAQAFLFPSLFEGFGLPILEAFACNCPVLTSNISSLPEVASKAALLVNPYSIDNILQGILQLTTNTQLRTNLIKAGQKQLKNFSWEKAAKETLEVLKYLK